MPEIPTIELTPEIGNMDIGIDMNMDIPTDMSIDAPVEIASINMPISVPTVEIQAIEVAPQIEAVQEIQEIQELPEINIEEPIEIESEIVEIETPEELKEPDMQEDMEVVKNDEQETEPESKTNDDSIVPNGGTDEPKAKEEKSVNKKKKDTKKTSTKKETIKDKTVADKSTTTSKSKDVVEVKKPTTNADNLGQISVINLVTLTSIPETITIQETVLLTQEMIYEQDIDAFTSSATYDSLISSSSSRWVRMVDVRPKHTFSGYGR